jgi:drug/metabolite transporter (DMT)-like permease
MPQSSVEGRASESRGAGIALRLAATFLFAVMSLCVRLASFEAPVGQIVFWRSAVALVPIVLYLAIRGQFPGALATTQPMGHLKRSLYGCAAMFFSFLSLANLPLALATGLGFLAPILAVLAAMAVLHERPGPIIIAAAIVGFVGICLMLWPSVSGPALESQTLIGVAAGIAMALTTAAAKIQIKTLTATEAPGTIAYYFAAICALAGLATAPFGWAEATGTTLYWLIGAGLAGGLAHIAMTEAVARAPVSLLAPFEYTAMLWAFAFDLLIFALVPTPFGLMGSVLIVGAALAVAFGDDIARRLKPGGAQA